MNLERQLDCPDLDPAEGEYFGLHPNFCNAINREYVQSEIEGGVSQHLLPIGAVLDVQTRHRVYRIVNREDRQILISGHPEFCPEPVLVELHGSTWGGSMIRNSYIGRGMHLEFRHPVHGVVLTSPIADITELPDADRSAAQIETWPQSALY